MEGSFTASVRPNKKPQICDHCVGILWWGFSSKADIRRQAASGDAEYFCPQQLETGIR